MLRHVSYCFSSPGELRTLTVAVDEHHAKPGCLLARLELDGQDFSLTAREDFGGTTPEVFADRLEELVAEIRSKAAQLRQAPRATGTEG